MRIVLLSVLTMVAATSLAAVPETITYQAYLTDRDGAALSDEYLVTFTLYNVEVSGSPLWSDTMLVDVDNGLFSVELGRSANSFPVDLFNTPLWLGIAIETDMEMIPRRALTSAAFSFKADDADSLQGKSVADLDQSTHVDNLDNPHFVTAAQVNAADQSLLDAHTGDLSNPHQTTAMQTGAIDAATFSVHVATGDAHHVRYGDGEAMVAVLAADGPGSGLDADTIDGVESSEFATASNTYSVDQLYTQTEVNVLIQTLQAQIDLLASPSTRFTDQGDGTIRDNRSGLVWLKNANCLGLLGAEPDGTIRWHDADLAVERLNSGDCGLGDGSINGEWRLPTLAELTDLLDTGFSNPALSNTQGDLQWTENDPFVGVQNGVYWTSSTYWEQSTGLFAWRVDLGDAAVGYSAKSAALHLIWPVR